MQSSSLRNLYQLRDTLVSMRTVAQSVVNNWQANLSMSVFLRVIVECTTDAIREVDKQIEDQNISHVAAAGETQK